MNIKNCLVSTMLAIILMCLLFTTPKSFANDYNFNYREQMKVDENVTSLTTDVFGDKIDNYSGDIEFNQTDISIPGNFGISVAVSRTLLGPDNWTRETREFGNWSLAVPYIKSNYITDENLSFGTASWPNRDFCARPMNSNPSYSRAREGQTYRTSPNEYWIGEQLYIPGVNKQLVLENNGERVLKDGWKIDCLSENGKDYFLVTSTTGTQYKFSQQKVVRAVKNVNLTVTPTSANCQIVIEENCQENEGVTLGGDSPVNLPSFYMFLLVTEITDKFGNTVNYNYDGDKLTSITSSDNRTITFDYNSDGHIQFVHADTRTYEYKYNSSGLKTLTEVILPNNTKWEFDYSVANSPFWNLEHVDYQPQLSVTNNLCLADNREYIEGTSYVKITHPSGLQGQFNVRNRCMSTAETPKFRFPNTQFFKDTYWIQNDIRVYSLSNKTIKLSGEEYVWKYSYSNNPGYFEGDSPSQAANSGRSATGLTGTQIAYTDVEMPEGDTVQYLFDRRFGARNGVLVKSNFMSAEGKLLKSVENKYSESPVYGDNKLYYPIRVSPDEFDVLPQKSPSQTLNLRLSEIKEKRHYVDGIDTYKVAYSDFNTFDLPQTEKRYKVNSTDYMLLTKEYHHDFELNHLNQIKKETSAKSSNLNDVTLRIETEFKDFTINSKAIEMPSVVKQLGRVVSKFTQYHDDGNIRTIHQNIDKQLGTGKRFSTYNNFYRGQPSVITLPKRYSNGTIEQSATYDYFGQITSIADLEGVKSYYKWDNVGRLISIDVANDSFLPENQGKWLDGLFIWDDVNLTRTKAVCKLAADRASCIPGTIAVEEFEQYDEMLRLLSHRVTDVQNSSSRYAKHRYNYRNQRTFEAYPSENDNNLYGLTTSYDEFGRVVSVVRDGFGTSIERYRARNIKEVIDEKGNKTEVTYISYGLPNDQEDFLGTVTYPEGVTLTHTYNNFNQLTSIEMEDVSGQSVEKVTEVRKYNTHGELCYVSRPETGVTLAGFNNVGEQVWSAKSNNATGCVSTQPANATTLVLDNWGDKHQINYFDDTPDYHFLYDPQGRITLHQVGDIKTTFSYTNQGKLLSEILDIEGKQYQTSYVYNNTQDVVEIHYPQDLVVKQTVNGFGEITSIKGQTPDELLSILDNVKYHANGLPKSYQYGNGLTYESTWNSFDNKFSAMKLNGASGSVISKTYQYDEVGNLTRLQDLVDSSRSLTNMRYDQLNRLASLSNSGNIGNSSFNYDGIGNIILNTSPNKKLRYDYSSDETVKDSLSNVLRKVYDDSQSGSLVYDFDYDDSGNVISDGINSYTYLLDGNMYNMTSANGTTNYKYNAVGYRVSEQTDNDLTYFLYSQNGQLRYQEKEFGYTQYIYLGNQLVAKLGNVVPSGDDEYRPFGDSVSEIDSGPAYTGHYYDSESGLTYMGGRFYNAELGRFYSVDPQSYKTMSTFNRYSYANNNPYRYLDPNGQYPDSWQGWVRLGKETVALGGHTAQVVTGATVVAAGVADIAAGTKVVGVLLVGGGSIAVTGGAIKMIKSANRIAHIWNNESYKEQSGLLGDLESSSGVLSLIAKSLGADKTIVGVAAAAEGLIVTVVSRNGKVEELSVSLKTLVGHLSKISTANGITDVVEGSANAAQGAQENSAEATAKEGSEDNENKTNEGSNDSGSGGGGYL